MNQLLLYVGGAAVLLIAVWIIGRAFTQPFEPKPKAGPSLKDYFFFLLIAAVMTAGGSFYTYTQAWAEAKEEMAVIHKKWEKITMSASRPTQIHFIQGGCKDGLKTCDWIANIDDLGGQVANAPKW